MKLILKIILLGAVLLAQPFLLAQSTIVAATKIQDNTGALLSSGQFCVGSDCFAVTTGAITSRAIISTTANITMTNGGSTTYLTVPNVTVSGAYWSFDSYIVPSTASITGLGTPRIACQPGAVYTQTDGDHNKWVCTGINGVGTWNGVLPPTSGGGGGTVTSIGISWPSIFCPTGPNPITSTGTIIASLCDAPPRAVFAGPLSGSGTAPIFRSLGVPDMPFTYSGTTTKLATVTGSQSAGVALSFDTNGNIVAGNSGVTFSGTVNASQVIGLAPSATIDTTNASNITSGTLSLARLPSTLFGCPVGQAVGSFALNNSTPNCIPFQGVVASGQQYALPTYLIAGGGTTLGPSLATVDVDGNLGGANIAASGILSGASLSISGNATVGSTLTAGVTTVANLTSSGPISGTSISGTGLNITGSFAPNQVYASSNGSAGNLGLRSLVTQDLPFTYSGNSTKLVTTDGPLISGHGVSIDSNGNLVDSGSSSGGSSSINMPGYQVFPSGLIMQWGYGVYDKSKPVTLPLPMTTCFGVEATDNGGSTTPTPEKVGAQCTSTTVTLYPEVNGVGVFWVVYGK